MFLPGSTDDAALALTTNTWEWLGSGGISGSSGTDVLTVPDGASTAAADAALVTLLTVLVVYVAWRAWDMFFRKSPIKNDPGQLVKPP